jgi:lipoprotein-anchoring transpeptidase ErfK/SrfK
MQTGQCTLHISVRDQRLTVKLNDVTVGSYPVSTSRFGLGSEEGSMRTPLGDFRIAEKIGAEAPVGTIFRDRRPLDPVNWNSSDDDDLVMSRILWLDGLEEHNANTYDRYIYIHGTNQEEKVGTAASHGCIRMKNADLVELFDFVGIDTPVTIEA